jgi:ribosomal protein L20
VYALVKKGILARIGRGKFCLGSSNNFIPEISRKEKIIYNKLINEFPFVELCVWNTKILNEFMQHQPGNFQVIVELEKEVIQSAFYFLKELNYPVFIEPTVDIIEKYLPIDKEAIIIKSLVSESPLQEVDNIKTVTIEKLLVDVFSDVVVFAAQQGAELRTILIEAFDKYTINQSKMLRYANRRRKKEGFQQYIDSFQIYGSK